MKRVLPVLLTLALVAAACGDDDDAAPTSGGADGTEVTAADVVAHYADGVHASYSASLASATELDAAIDAFVAAPSQEGLQAARNAWLAARDDYGVTEAFRFYGGPIDNDDRGVEGLVNAWPMDEAHVDYVEGDPDAGIVNDPGTYPEIDADLLVSLNEEGGEANISTGWHAIEFLLWGQDLSEDGPGARPFTDYTDAPNADRRGTYLAVASDLLLGHLQGLVDAWAPDSDNFRADFEGQGADGALHDILTGIGELSRGELAGERMSVAYTERSQEDEHSCFSDNTTADIVANAQGIANVITGAYPGGVSGPGIADLVAGTDTDLADRLAAGAADSVAAARSIPAPFDQHLREDVADDSEGRTIVLTTIEMLEDQTDTIVAAADALEVEIEVT